nr:ribonuclease H-like domain-containing protein [Tanacetum cinerariifolium]
MNPMMMGEIVGLKSARRDEKGHPNDNTSAEANYDNLESAIPDENDNESKGVDITYQEFNDQFQSPDLNPDSHCVNLRRSTRKTSMPAKLSDFEINTKVKYNIDKQVNYYKLSVENFNFSTSLNKISKPKSYTEATNDIRWIEAMNQEMEALNRNGTYTIADLPAGRKPIGSKWVYKVNWPIYQLYINNAFLYGELVEDVYISLLKGYFNKDDNRAKCKATRKLVNGYSIVFGKSLISWKSKKHSMHAKSFAKAEYRAMITITCEVIGI